MLSDSESEPGNNDVQLTINEHFAKAYAYKKEREELGRLQEKYGPDAELSDEEDSEDSETEDEDGEELTPAVDAAILRTLARIKRGDPDIYDKEKSIFAQEQKRTGQMAQRTKTAAKDTTKPLTIKQHALSSILNTGSRSPSPEPQIVTHDQEQHALRSEAISAFHNALDNDEDDDGFLVPREKNKDEIDQEEEEYKAFLEREVGEDIKGLVSLEHEHPFIREAEDKDEDEYEDEEAEGDETSPKGKKKKKRKKGKEKAKPREETDQEFLMNYILNRGWIDRSSKRVPTYNEVTHGAKEDENKKNHEGDPAELIDDEEFENIVEKFETSYNFRFEEPGADVIQTHPRDIGSTVRRQDTTRKEARERRKQRKEEELLRKKEEVKRMKALKMKELRQKIEKIGREGGVDIESNAFADFDLDGDWDPEKHDNQMAGIYDGEDQEDTEKPQWDDDIDVGDIIVDNSTEPSTSKSQKKKKKKKSDEAVVDGVDIDAMDADAPIDQDEEEWDGTEEMRKRKVQEYMDEVYGMEFNDMVGDLPTRFKYATVMPHSYALTPAETLLATDAELNEYIGIKKYAPYRKDGKWDSRRADRLKELKQKVKERSWGAGDTTAHGEEQKKTKKRKGKKERLRAKAEGEAADGDEGNEGEPPRKKGKHV